MRAYAVTTTFGRAIRRRFSLLRNESGQSLVVIVLSIFVVFGIAAVAIDLSTWYQKHHQAQVAADAAALAAANCLANSGSGQTCTSLSDTTDAINVATTYAANNGVTIPTSDVNFDNPTYPSEVTVTTPNQTSAMFAGVLGLGAPTATAKSTATWRATSADCTNSGAGCQLIFANDKSCTGGVTLSPNGTPSTIQGGIESNGSITTNSSGNPTVNSKPTYQQGCSGPSTSSATAPWKNKASTKTIPSYWPNDWPVDYRDYYPACPGYSQTTHTEISCSGPGGTPSYCDQAAGSFTNPTTTNQIYCAYGTGTPADPSTWNGTISQTGALAATYIAGYVNINYSGNGTISPKPGNHLLAYAAAASTTALQLTVSGSGTLSGDEFAPFGTAIVTLSGTPSGNGIFVEGLDVNFTANGTPTADGPPDNTLGQPPTSPSDALLN